jgi:hypothetical protein
MICAACELGMHDRCAAQYPPPPGMVNKANCDCDGKCKERLQAKYAGEEK